MWHLLSFGTLLRAALLHLLVRQDHEALAGFHNGFLDVITPAPWGEGRGGFHYCVVPEKACFLSQLYVHGDSVITITFLTKESRFKKITKKFVYTFVFGRLPPN
jgi:hypothetical protein